MSEDSASRRPLSVLLVEEDQSVANLVMTALRTEGYLVIGCVASVGDAKRAVKAEQPDLVILHGRMIPFEKFGQRSARESVPRDLAMAKPVRGRRQAL